MAWFDLSRLRDVDFRNPDPALVYIALAVALATSLYQWLTSAASAEGAASARKPAAGLPDPDPEDRRRLIRVNDRVVVAYGYGPTNSVLIEGTDGCVLLDAQDSVHSAIEVQAAFKYVTEKPVRAVVLTRPDSPDHAGGLAVWRLDDDRLPVYAHEGGDDGGGGGDDEDDDGRLKTFKDRLDVDLCGLRLTLIHAPGPCKGQAVVWWEKEKTLFAGDTVYKAFPAIFGDSDCLEWVQSLDLMRFLRAKVLIPQRCRPVLERPEVDDVLTAYRDAMQFVHDQTVRLLNKGTDLDAIARTLELPRVLKQHPYLQEHYATLASGARAVASQYAGRNASAGRGDCEFSALIGRDGARAGFEKAREALKEGRYGQAVRLCDLLLLEGQGQGQASWKDKAAELKTQSLNRLSSLETTLTERDWHPRSSSEKGPENGLTSAKTGRGLAKNGRQRLEEAETTSDLLAALSTLLRVEWSKFLEPLLVKVVTRDEKLENESSYFFELRNGIMDTSLRKCDRKSDRKSDVEIVTTSDILREMLLAKKPDLNSLLADEKLLVRPDIDSLGPLLDCFDV